jgi:hypothetical protein
MKCFECGSKCITQYWNNNFLFDGWGKITHVNKACVNCTWQSFKTRLPVKLP